MWSRFPCQLTESCYSEDASGKSKMVMEGHQTWQPSLVLALVRPSRKEQVLAILRYGSLVPRQRMDQAILFSATCCSRCLNRMAHRVGLSWGYRAGSPEDIANTSCEHCQP
jgi:hypothetical protein